MTKTTLRVLLLASAITLGLAIVGVSGAGSDADPSSPKAGAAAATLHGFGASRRGFAAGKAPDPNPKLIKGCCFLPRQRDGRDRYYSVLYDERGHVYSYSMAYAPSASIAMARKIVRAELPGDASLLFDVKKSRCEIVQYRSRSVGRALRGTSVVDAALYSSTTGAQFNRRTVTEIVFVPGVAHDRSVSC
jgi:hypothetical protein